MFRDLRFAARMLLKESGFTTITVLTLALGIGATSAVFSLIQGVLLTPPPYRQPERLVLIPSTRTDGQQMAQPRAVARCPMDGMAEGREDHSSRSPLRVVVQLPDPGGRQRIDRGHGGQ